MLITVEGVYRNGQVELNETPLGIPDGTRVVVTFLPAPREQDSGQMITYGKYKGPIDMTEDDFKIVEFHSDPDAGQE